MKSRKPRVPMARHFNELRDYFFYVFAIMNPGVMSYDARVFSYHELSKGGL